MKVSINYPVGYCKGVYKAIEMAKQARIEYPNEKIYCLNQIVHNDIVNNNLKDNGIIILNGNINELIDSIDNGVVIFSAHGSDERLLQKAKNKGLTVINTICEHVQRSMDIIKKYLEDDYDVIFIGKKNHPEANAICSISSKIHLIEKKEDIESLDLKKVVVANQTTISISSLISLYEAIKVKYPNAILIDEICNATRIRQESILNINDDVDGIIVIGDKKSNNTNSLYKIALTKHDAIMVNSYNEIDKEWLKNKNNIILASGTSAPIELINDIYNKLK